MVEGAKALSDALDAKAHVRAVFAAPGAPGEVVDRAAASGTTVHRLAPGVIERVAPAVTPQPVLGIVDQLDVGLAALAAATLLVVAVDVADPGNLGMLVRTAEAAGADGIVCCGAHVDIYNPKTVRAAAGSLFRLPVVAGGDPLEVLDQLGAWGLRRLGTVPRGGLDYNAAELRRPVAIVLGSEATGLPDPVLAAGVDDRVTIPMAGRAESLNVGAAAAILCFEVARQRRQAEDPPDGA